ncbi:MAG: type II secretion system F family protein, partial [Bacillota bacterium]|nr:type II secretion system F family protein [Bacillota bacterium]
MTAFSYESIDMHGVTQEGIYEAESESEVLRFIRSNGQKPLRIKSETKDKNKNKNNKIKNKSKTKNESNKNENQSILNSEIKIFRRKPKIKDLIIFCRQLYTMLNAGMPLISGLEVLSDQSENAILRETIDEITESVKKGKMLSESMGEFPKIFPPLLINMIQAGEMTGNLDDVLNKMSVHYDKENRINQKIKRAMIYPTVLIFIATAAVIFLLTFVMPTIVGMFDGTGVELPFITRVVLSISDVVKYYWYIIAAIIMGIVVIYKQMVRTKPGKRTRDKFVLSIPVIKKQTIKIVTSRFIRTLSTLIGSGIPILQALETSAEVTNNEVLIEGIQNVSEDIKKGESLSYLLGNLDIFPKMTVSMIKIGEETGALEDMLAKTADYYDDELEASLEKLVALVEPIGILVMGLVIGFIVIAMMLPMFDMFQT